jgi:hypothetical protein
MSGKSKLLKHLKYKNGILFLFIVGHSVRYGNKKTLPYSGQGFYFFT